MPTLSDVFADLFVCVLLFEERLRDGSEPPSCAEIRCEINTLLAGQDRAAKSLNLPERDYQEARFAVLTWVDDTLLGCLTGAALCQWQATPMLCEHGQMGRTDADLRERLGALRADQHQVREIYELCLGLNNHRHLEPVQATPPRCNDESDIPFLTPHLYEVTSPNPSPKTSWFRHCILDRIRTGSGSMSDVYSFCVGRWRTPYRKGRARYSQRVGTALLVIIPILLAALAVALIPPPPAPHSEHEPPTASSPQPQSAVSSPSEPVELIAGRMEPSPLQTPPFREIIELLQPLTQHAQSSGFAVTVKPKTLDAALVHPERADLIYRIRDYLTLDIQTPAAFSSYVYIAYGDATGRVGYLFPNAIQPINHFRPGSTFTFGDPQGPAPWRISPPSGRDLLVVIASKKQLFGPQELISTSIDSALSALRQALQGVAPSDLVATFAFLTIQGSPRALIQDPPLRAENR